MVWNIALNREAGEILRTWRQKRYRTKNRRPPAAAGEVEIEILRTEKVFRS